MVNEIKKVIINDKTEKKLGKVLKFSEDKNKRVKDGTTVIFRTGKKCL